MAALGDYAIARTDDEIDYVIARCVIARCVEKIQAGGSSFPGKTYDEGVRAALDWVMGNTDVSPFDDEDSLDEFQRSRAREDIDDDL